MASFDVVAGTVNSAVIATLTATLASSDGVATSSTASKLAISDFVIDARLPDAVVNKPYTYALKASGGTGPLTWSAASTLPSWLILTADGTLSGTPTGTADSKLAVRVVDASGATTTATLILRVVEARALQIETASLPDAVARTNYRSTVSATGGTPPYDFRLLSGALPAGLKFDNTGALSGAPGQGGKYSFVIQVQDADNGVASREFTLRVRANRPDIKVAGIRNGASFSEYVSPGMWVSIFGTDLASVPAPGRKWAEADFAGGALPLTLEGTSVTVNGVPAPISWVGPEQLNILMPDGDYTGPVPVEVSSQGATFTTSVTVSPVAPALFFSAVNGRNYAAIVDSNGVAIGPPELPGSRRALPGEVLMLFGSGFGRPNSDGVAKLNMVPAPLTLPFRIEVAGTEAGCQYGGLVGPGLNQFNIVVPSLPPGEYPITVSIGGTQTESGVFLVIGEPAP
jgi:uncharacterized protein (TIGR03437 family)